jgi:4-diphosphocytidyl-2-C-methyl-D-erythritol kinase
MTSATAPAKINLALVVGPLRADGRHEVATVLQRVDLADDLTLEPADELRVSGFADDTLVSRALEAFAAAAGVEPNWHVSIEKRIPVAGGLGGGSSDAATALRLANETLDDPLDSERLIALAARIGADVPFFLVPGHQLGTGDGTHLEPLELPDDYRILLLLPPRAAKESTAAVYAEFDRREGHQGFDERRRKLQDALAHNDLAALPPNDLAQSPFAAELERLGAFRADVSGAGPTVYGLFREHDEITAAAAALGHVGETWICSPTWYG